MHIHNNSVLHYLYKMAVGLVIYSKARAFKGKAKNSRPRINIPGYTNRFRFITRRGKYHCWLQRISSTAWRCRMPNTDAPSVAAAG